MAACFWCGEQCGGTCLGINHENGPRQMKTSDPAYWMLSDGRTTTKGIHRDGCYICEDVEFAQMGLPLCQPCPRCSEGKEQAAGHIPADDEECEDCGYNARVAWEEQEAV